MKKTLILLAALLFSTMYTSARRVVFVTVDGYAGKSYSVVQILCRSGIMNNSRQIIGKQQPKNAEAC